jgi:hypothetical protein
MGKNKTKKANIASQNPDTTISAINANDTRPYEQKNMPKGAFKKNSGSK